LLEIVDAGCLSEVSSYESHGLFLVACGLELSKEKKKKKKKKKLKLCFLEFFF
jgi:hypothetical protein